MSSLHLKQGDREAGNGRLLGDAGRGNVGAVAVGVVRRVGEMRLQRRLLGLVWRVAF